MCLFETMEAYDQYSLLLRELECLVEQETRAIVAEDWAGLANVLRGKQTKLQDLAMLKRQVNVETLELKAILHRMEREEATACRALECKLDEAYRAIDQQEYREGDKRLNLMKEIVGMHKSQRNSSTLKGAA